MTEGLLEWTGERYLPEVGGTIALEHLHLYLMASELARGKERAFPAIHSWCVPICCTSNWLSLVGDTIGRLGQAGSDDS